VPEAIVTGRAGSVKVGWTDRGVCRAVLVSRCGGVAAVECGEARPGRGVQAVLEGLKDYLCGGRGLWDDAAARDALPLDFGPASAFRRRVWDTTRAIPYGQVRTYGWIARQLGRPGAGRAVGGAMAANPLPIIIPCHRVVGSSFRLGNFSSGVEWKAHLHALEGIRLPR